MNNLTDKQYTNTTPAHAINNIPTKHQFIPTSVYQDASVPLVDSMGSFAATFVEC